MIVLISYDVSTTSMGGPRRLRKIARACLDHGQRVQYSVFECSVTSRLWVQLKAKLLKLYDPELDSLRFYYLGEDAEKRTEHHGTRPSVDLDGPLVV
ncbi:MAG: CRISPR-associated endonuclease Cas2 [Candidatus Wallbacteria bacterium]|nr:CRISPR-associated endonuclease Cas2 [Candidatus Wallbacteria bacterium]